MDSIDERQFERYYMLHGKFNSHRYLTEIKKDIDEIAFLKKSKGSFPGENYYGRKMKELQSNILKLQNAAEQHVPSSQREVLEESNEKIKRYLETLKTEPVKGSNLMKRVTLISISFSFFIGLLFSFPSITGASIVGQVLIDPNLKLFNYIGLFFIFVGLVGSYFFLKNNQINQNA